MCLGNFPSKVKTLLDLYCSKCSNKCALQVLASLCRLTAECIFVYFFCLFLAIFLHILKVSRAFIGIPFRNVFVFLVSFVEIYYYKIFYERRHIFRIFSERKNLQLILTIRFSSIVSITAERVSLLRASDKMCSYRPCESIIYSYKCDSLLYANNCQEIKCSYYSCNTKSFGHSI